MVADAVVGSVEVSIGTSSVVSAGDLDSTAVSWGFLQKSRYVRKRFAVRVSTDALVR